MRIKKYRVFAGDFETTVYKDQEYTEVWASGLCELNTGDIHIFGSINDTYKYLLSFPDNVMIYYHNLKFDGTFWLSYLIDVLGYKQAIREKNKSRIEIEWLQESFMLNRTFKYSISDRGQWYSIIIKANNKFIEIRDSLKLLPFSLKQIGQSFNTKHKKLEMEYEGFRYAGCKITEKEKEYLANDVYVLKEALEIMYDEGHTDLTIGACCLSEYKNIIGGKKIFFSIFPDLTQFALDQNIYKQSNADAYIRKSYRGGWCYLVPEKASKKLGHGITADVNSLYPSVMHSISGNRYPVGEPTFWRGNTIPEDALTNNRFYFIRISCRFEIKKDYLPFIQIKGSWLYRSTENLTTSDIRNNKGSFDRYYLDFDGNIRDSKVELTLTMTDWALFQEHYNIFDLEIISGCWFESEIGLFDEYIDKYAKIKKESKGAKRTLAKLFLNNLYGKMAASKESSFKVAYLDPEDRSIQFYPVEEQNKKPGYIAVGSAITSYARDFTIRAAQRNYHGPDKPGFIYADTDSIHCDIDANEICGIEIDRVEFCKWKLESYWDVGWFVRQKTYIERVTHEDGRHVKPYYNIKCAGMPDQCKELFIHSLSGDLFDWIPIKEYKKLKKYRESLDDEKLTFVKEKRELENFDIGLKIKGKLFPKRIQGGTILTEGYYEMRGVKNVKKKPQPS